VSNSSSKNAAIAAAVILVGVAVVFLAMPRIVVALGDISPWLGYAAVALFILGFFGIFWVRSRFQQHNRDGS
jgi:type II secretory pathway component PulF